MYNLATVAPDNPKEIAPEGWRVPTDDDWTTLTDYLIANGYGYGGSGDDIGKSMAATTDWQSSATAGRVGNDLASNNSSGFSGFPGGQRNTTGSFLNMGSFCEWWSATESTSGAAWIRNLYYDVDYSTRTSRNEGYGLSVRLIRTY